MDDSSKGDVTRLLQAWADGDKDALSQLVPLVYDEVHRVAHFALRREGPGARLKTTELVNEAYLRLVRQNRVKWQNRSHFVGIAAQEMRRVLVDQARKRMADKRGAGQAVVSLDSVQIAGPEAPVDLLALDEALRRLTEMDLRQGQIVELKFFGGLKIQEIADVVGVAPATVKRDSRSALAWLRRELSMA